RDLIVTGVQTCALPIFYVKSNIPGVGSRFYRLPTCFVENLNAKATIRTQRWWASPCSKSSLEEKSLVFDPWIPIQVVVRRGYLQIGRASCRERVEISGV